MLRLLCEFTSPSTTWNSDHLIPDHLIRENDKLVWCCFVTENVRWNTGVNTRKSVTWWSRAWNRQTEPVFHSLSDTVLWITNILFVFICQKEMSPVAQITLELTGCSDIWVTQERLQCHYAWTACLPIHQPAELATFSFKSWILAYSYCMWLLL